MQENVFVQIVWIVLGVAILGAAVLAGRSRRAMYVGRFAVATLFIVGGGLFNAVNLASGGADYKNFAEDSYIPSVRDTWESVVAPNVGLFISLLVAFEIVVGVLILVGGRKTQLGLVAAVGFHVALLSFGWGFYPWSIADQLKAPAGRQPVSPASDGSQKGYGND